LTDLPTKCRDTCPARRQLEDRAVLLADVVEVEHNQVGNTAIDALGSLQLLVRERNATLLAPQPRRRLGSPVVGAAPPAGSLGGAATVAVDANHLAARELASQSRDRRAACNEGREVSALWAYVIELEHERISLAAFNTLTSDEVGDDERSGVFDPSLPRRARLSTVEVAAFSEVNAKAVTTPPLVPVAAPVERLNRKPGFASAAPAAYRRPLRQMPRLGSGDQLGARSDGHVANPKARARERYV
jgi:hypothetical protein